MKASSAAEYRKRPAAAEGSTQLVKLPSGFVWELRAPNMLAYMATGRYPQSLVNKGLEVWKKNGVIPEDEQLEVGKQIIKEMKDEEIAQTLIFMRTLVQDACVKPRIVVGGVGEDELDPVEVDPEDFKFIFSWCIKHGGVQGIKALENFRGGQPRRTSGSKSNGKKLRTRSGDALAHK
jgi:hypothetical protein